MKRDDSEQGQEIDIAAVAKQVVALQKGDREAFRKIVELTQKPIFRFCAYLAGNRELAQDLFQESYLKAMDSIKTLKEPRKFKGWLLMIIRNLYYDHHRSKKGAFSLDEKDMDQLAEDEPSKATAESLLHIHRVIGDMDPDDRALILMVHLEGYSYSEVAEILEITEDLVKSRLFSARKRFIKKYEEK